MLNLLGVLTWCGDAGVTLSDELDDEYMSLPCEFEVSTAIDVLVLEIGGDFDFSGGVDSTS